MNNQLQLNEFELQTKYQGLSSPKKVVILNKALAYMQSYNGRTKLDCIALGMGYTIGMGTPKCYYINKKTK